MKDAIGWIVTTRTQTFGLFETPAKAGNFLAFCGVHLLPPFTIEPVHDPEQLANGVRQQQEHEEQQQRESQAELVGNPK